MIRVKLIFLLFLTILTGNLLAQDCAYPPLVEIPDGATATLDQMVAAQGNIQTFIADMTDYQDCINNELEVAGDDATDEFRAIMIGRFNAAATEIEAVAASFNEQIAAFRAANQ